MQATTTAKCFVWIELAIYLYLTWKRTLQLQNFLEFDFLRKRVKSVANSLEREIGREMVGQVWDNYNITHNVSLIKMGYVSQLKPINRSLTL